MILGLSLKPLSLISLYPKQVYRAIPLSLSQNLLTLFSLNQFLSIGLFFESPTLTLDPSLLRPPLVLTPGIDACDEGDDDEVSETHIAHPYLLADNRHYPFYIWRKIIQAHWTMKYLLVPLYVYSGFSIIKSLGEVQKSIWVLLFFSACGLVLIPAPLIEFRYYTIPFYFFILHTKINSNNVWLTIGAIYTATNIFTMTMFLYRPFHWDHEPGIQRFIW